MLRAAQRGMLRVIMQTKKKIRKQEGNWRKDICDDEISEETQEEISTHNERDQDSRFSFDDDEEKTQQAMKIILKTGLNT